MNVTEVLQITAETLSEIQIPARLAEQIGKPILGCIGNLRLCIDALEKAAAEPPADTPEAETETAPAIAETPET